MPLQQLYFRKCLGDNGCNYEEVHCHGLACDRSCEECRGTVLGQEQE